MRHAPSAVSLSLSLSLFICVTAHAQNAPFNQFNGVASTQVNSPSVVLTKVNCSATTTWTYYVTAIDASGGSTAGTMASLSSCSTSTVSTTSYNLLSITAPVGAVSCNVYRTAPTGTNYNGRIVTVPCGGSIAATVLDTGTNALDPSTAPAINSTGGLAAKGTVTGLNFLAGGTAAGTSDWVAGMALPLCGTGQLQPCIQTNSFFLQAPMGPITTFGWTAPAAASSANAPLIVGQSSSSSGVPTSALSYGTLTDPSSITPAIATANGATFTGGDLVYVNKSSSNVNLGDSLISITSQPANTVLSGPSGGSAAAPTFRSLVPADMPALPYVSTTYGTTAVSFTQNQIKFFGIETLTAVNSSTLTFYVVTADTGTGSGHRYDIGIYSGSAGGTGTLLLHLGTTTGVNGSTLATTNGTLNQGLSWGSGPAALPPGRYYLALTTDCSSSCATIGGGPSATGSQFTFASTTSGSSSSGALPSSGVTLPADSWTNAVLPAIVIR